MMQLEICTSFMFSCSFFNVKDDIECLLIDSMDSFDDDVDNSNRASLLHVETFVFLNSKHA